MRPLGGALFNGVVSPMLLGVVRYGVIAAVAAATLPVPDLSSLVGVVPLVVGCDVPVKLVALELHAATKVVARSRSVAARLRLIPTCIPWFPVSAGSLYPLVPAREPSICSSIEHVL